MSSFLRLTCALLGVLASACSAGPRVTWEVDLRALRGSPTAPAWIVVERRAGDCRGPAQDVRVVAFEQRGSLASSTVSLPSGPHGFAASALDGSCNVIGTGCTDLVLGPATPTIVVTVVPVTPTACGADCAVPACARAGSDGGGSDGGAGRDAGGLDAAEAGASGTDAGDAGTPDASPFACRAAATSLEECAMCPGLWCDAICCAPTLECCPDGSCRRVCDMMMPP